MTKLELLRDLSFGSRIAEEEAAELKSYFVKTDTWNRIFAGEIDIIYGSKGAGKSAIYAVLADSAPPLIERGVFLTTAENPRGATVFRDLVDDPPTSEREFMGMWKLYFLMLVGWLFKEVGLANQSADALIAALTEAKLLEPNASLQTMLKSAFGYVRRLLSWESISTTVEIDPMTGLPKGLTGKITLREPTNEEKEKGFASAESLFALANDALECEKKAVWILLDRLDVAFADQPKLEQGALRALFKVYLDLVPYPRLNLKIFIRTDIWKRLTTEGFREASHITRDVTISWDSQELLNLIIRRVVRNAKLCEYYGVSETEVLQSSESQEQLFKRIFPEKIDLSEKKPATFDWILSRTRDGTGISAPREIIHLLSAAREQQIKYLERGDPEPPEGTLFIGQAFKDALPAVSKARFQNTLLAEYPQYRERLLKLEGKRTQQSIDALAEVWSTTLDETQKIAAALVECGFFEPRGGKQYWVPFLYRPCLSMVQGSEE
jgi:hypothetical protein